MILCRSLIQGDTPGTTFGGKTSRLPQVLAQELQELIYPATTRLLRVPAEPTVTSTTSPTCSKPASGGVPVMITSPGSRVMIVDRKATRSRTLKAIKVLDAAGDHGDSACQGKEDSLFCRLVRSSECGILKCKKSYASAGLQAAKFGIPYIFRCHAGLIPQTKANQRLPAQTVHNGGG